MNHGNKLALYGVNRRSLRELTATKVELTSAPVNEKARKGLTVKLASKSACDVLYVVFDNLCLGRCEVHS